MRLNLFQNPVDTKGCVLGCSACPLDKVPDVVKIKGLDRIKARRAMIWSQSPNFEETEKELELVGKGGRLLWKALEHHKLSRFMFDIQNVLRCRPLSRDGSEHEPDKRELLCCSAYNDEALTLNRERAHVHVILGEVAGRQLLGSSFRKDQPVMWHAPWNAYVVLNAHPNFIQKLGGEDAGFEWEQWRGRFAAVASILKFPGRYGYLKARDYRIVRTKEEFDAMEREIRAEAKKRRISFDIEDDVVDGKRVLLMAGFGTGHFTKPGEMSSWTGRSWSVILEHPESGYSPGHLSYMKERVRSLVTDASIRKTLQNGSYDCNTCRESLGATLRGYDYDTQYGTYLAYSFLRDCSLDNLTYTFFPEFGDYKTVVDPWYTNRQFSKTPIELLALRNSGDCDVTKRLEERFSPEVSQPLVKVYIHAGKTLDKMEKRGPILDWENWNRANDIVPKLMAKLDRMLQRVSGKPDFNVDSPDVAKLVYDTLGLPITEAGRSTAQPVLELLQAETGNRTLDIIVKRRGLGKILGTYLTNYANSAKHHNDELHTRWALTGAVTGRLRSTGSNNNGVNLQNLAGEPLLKNLIVSDKNWRRALKD